MKVNTKYTKEQIEWIKKHALNDDYKAYIYPKKQCKKRKKRIISTHTFKVERNPSYNEQLKDKRWLNRRLQILKKKGAKCSKCSFTSNLQIHHLRYIKGKMAWEYKDKYLEVLCNECHEKKHCIDLDREFLSIIS